MVLLTQTPRTVGAIKEYNALQPPFNDADVSRDSAEDKPSPDEPIPIDPPLSEPSAGKPISHAQLIHISKSLQSHYPADRQKWRLETLLKGAEVFTPPPKPKPTQSSEYHELMARLRREEETRQYARMTAAPAGPSNPFSVMSPPSSFSANPASSNDGDDDFTLRDINRQLTLVLNILVSIVACGIAIWLVSWHWSTPSRLALAMGGAVAVGVAEVVVYWAYLRKVEEARGRERKKGERKVVGESWVLEGRKKGVVDGRRVVERGGSDKLKALDDELPLGVPGVLGDFEQEREGAVRRRTGKA